jgi:hypothetical protein
LKLNCKKLSPPPLNDKQRQLREIWSFLKSVEDGESRFLYTQNLFFILVQLHHKFISGRLNIDQNEKSEEEKHFQLKDYNNLYQDLVLRLLCEMKTTRFVFKLFDEKLENVHRRTSLPTLAAYNPTEYVPFGSFNYVNNLYQQANYSKYIYGSPDESRTLLSIEEFKDQLKRLKDLTSKVALKLGGQFLSEDDCLDVFSINNIGDIFHAFPDLEEQGILFKYKESSGKLITLRKVLKHDFQFCQRRTEIYKNYLYGILENKDVNRAEMESSFTTILNLPIDDTPFPVVYSL